MERTRDLLFKFPLLRGEDVRAVQLALTTLNIQPPCGAADGIFGPGTPIQTSAREVLKQIRAARKP